MFWVGKEKLRGVLLSQAFWHDGTEAFLSGLVEIVDVFILDEERLRM